jgi:signal transduction histidine kinase
MSKDVFARYRELQRYVGWTADDAQRVASVAALIESHLAGLVEDFYAEISRHPEARKVITGGEAQVSRLKQTLVRWLQELFSGNYDADYVDRRWKVGYRHVEIGLDQVYTNAALSRLRRRAGLALEECLRSEADRLAAVLRSLNMLIDLDLAIIEDAYQAEYSARQQRIERLATIGQIAGGIAHELRNPLNVIKTSVYYLLNARVATPEKTADHLHRIERQVDLSEQVISALSTIAKLPIPNLQPVILKDCVAESLQAESLPASVEVTVSCPVSVPPVLADGKQLRICLGNLIRNAADAMPAGGRLAIRARAVDGHVELAVADSGTGIAPEHLRHIMEPFYSTKSRGIGLGLALTRAILDKNRGSLHVTSEVGRGSTFFVHLTPASSDGSHEKSDASQS